MITLGFGHWMSIGSIVHFTHLPIYTGNSIAYNCSGGYAAPLPYPFPSNQQNNIDKMYVLFFIIIVVIRNGMVFSQFYGKVGVIYFDYFSISFEKITFYAEILTRKVKLSWIFSLVSLVKKNHNTTIENISKSIAIIFLFFLKTKF